MKEIIKGIRNLSLAFVITVLTVERFPYLTESIRPYLAYSLVAMNTCLIFEIIFLTLNDSELSPNTNNSHQQKKAVGRMTHSKETAGA